MIVIGLAGPARAGKNEVAKYLVERYGFVQFAFSDALYAEVQAAYGLEDQELLRAAATKEEPTERLALKNCKDTEFVDLVTQIVDAQHRAFGIEMYLYPVGVPLSPREVLQWWGTEYRRAQNEDYWVSKAVDFIDCMVQAAPYPELSPQRFVETGTRFENERLMIVDSLGWVGNIWHIHRGDDTDVNNHVSTTPLPVLVGERELWNNDSIERLHAGIDLLLSTSARFVRVEPMQRVSGTCSPEEYQQHVVQAQG